MPVWTPGSYLVREFARNVEAVTAIGETEKNLSVTKTRKNRWTIEAAGSREIRLSYRVYCREMSVRTNWVEDSFAFLNGAATFMTPVSTAPARYEVRLDLPSDWKTSAAGLEELGSHHYTAPDFDTLVDSPILAGNPAVYRFEVDGIPHALINVNEEGVWDGPRSVVDAAKIVRRYREMWGSLPYKKYVFLNLLTEAGGGLEHANSCVLMTSRWATSTRRAYLNWLSLLSHEYLHVWNVKRLRPVELGPFDYESENHTRALWVAEGFTNYYDSLMVHRAGLSTREEYLGDSGLSGLIHSLQTTPGRLVVSVEQSSFDAWIKLYRPDENTANTSISYYVKGAVVAWLLDARIRVATQGAKSLDDLMRLAFEKFSGVEGFTLAEFKATAEDVTGASLTAFFARSVESTEELDYTEALDWFGLRFHRAGHSEKAWLGAETKNDAGRLVVSKVPRGTPADKAGLSVDDEIVAIDHFRVRADQLAARLDNYSPGSPVSILVARREKLVSIALTLGEEPARTWLLEARPSPTPEQKIHLKDWLAR